MSFGDYAIEKYNRRNELKEYDSIPTGSDLLDLIVGGQGYPVGKIINLIGDSSAGKTFFACEAVYQAKKKYGNKVQVRYNDAESGFNFDTEELYGFNLREDMVQTPTIQEFAADLGVFAKDLKKDDFGIYIVDSFDGLCSDADLEEFDARINAYEKDKTYNKGTYDMSKQKYSSKLFRTLSQTIQNKNILLIIISQIRDNVGVSFGTNWTVSGGKALKFYCTVRLFLKSREKFSKMERDIGYCAEVTAIKSRSKHPNRKCFINILFEYGMDNISSNIDFLFDIKDSSGKIDNAKAKTIQWKEGEDVTPESMKRFLEENELLESFNEEYKRYSHKRALEFIESNSEIKQKFVDQFGTMEREPLIKYVEENELDEELAARTIKKWNDIEEAIRPNRKQKRL